MFFMARQTAPTLPGSEGRDRIITMSSKRMVLHYPIIRYNPAMEPIFAGKHALVIGGTGGIGREVALGLASRGASLTIHGGHSEEKLETILEEARRSVPAAGFLYPAAGNPVDAADAAAVILEKTGKKPDILVCAWGPFKKLALQETNASDWYFLIENNLILPGILISELLCDMINKKRGRILLFGGTNTSEIRGFSTTAAYSAAKTALGVLAKSVAKSAGSAGITCNVVCPGLTDTEYTSREDQEFNRKKSGGKVLGPLEIARVAFEILENPALNGAVIPVDGGIRV
jgi:NAD(P)-dependent dehydrogenase (short-subunit alcohol dehydrogenase family)